MRCRLALAALLLTAACRDVVAPTRCEGITAKGGAFHADTTVTVCR